MGAKTDPAAKTVSVFVNGDPKLVPEGLTLAEAQPLLAAPREGFAVERNGAVVPRSAFAATRLEAGDRLEIVTFVGGG
jgi:thiazole synthase/sulfur carrier protein